MERRRSADRVFVTRRSRRLFRACLVIARGGQHAADVLSHAGEAVAQDLQGNRQAEGFIQVEAWMSQGLIRLPGPISIHLLLQPHPKLKTLDPKPFAEIKAMGLFADGSGDQLNLGAVQGFGLGA